MSVSAKICGVNAPDAVRAVVAGGASHMGLVFYPPSPRAVTPAEAAMLVEGLPDRPCRVGLFVDPDDAAIAAVLAALPLGLIQLHGEETPARASAIRARFGCPVMKAIRVAEAADLDAAEAYAGAVDWLLFDARPPAGLTGTLPGGNALSFDWRLLAGRRWPAPWMLSGGLDAANVARAVAATGARAVDVSSGVENRRGHKDPALIAAFLATVADLDDGQLGHGGLGHGDLGHGDFARDRAD